MKAYKWEPAEPEGGMTMKKAKPTNYNGVRYKSTIEALVMEAFDNLNLSVEYEPESFRGPGYHHGQYTPDFRIKSPYGDDYDIWVEVAGFWDERHEKNARTFMLEGVGNYIVIDGRGWILSPVDGYKRGHWYWSSLNDRLDYRLDGMSYCPESECNILSAGNVAGIRVLPYDSAPVERKHASMARD